MMSADVLGPLNNETVADLAGCGYLSYVDCGVDTEGAFVETDDGRGYHVVGYTDYLHFALEHGHLKASALRDSGWLTDAAQADVVAALREILTERSGLGAHIIDTLTVDDTSGDEPGIEVAITIGTDEAITVKQAFDTIMWPFWSAMANLTDPGTFNYPYLWDRI